MDAKQVFDQASADYDRTRRQFIPCFDEFYGTALELIPFQHDAPIRVVDLGAGTGLVSSMVVAAFPNAMFTLVDLSADMLAKARERFAHRPGFAFELLNLETEPLAGHYDLAISALALHHIAPANLKSVFAKIYAVLDGGGIFINADQALGTSAENERRYAQARLDGVRARGCSASDIEVALGRMKADKTALLDDQLRWLREVGFAHVDCWFKRYRFTVYSGQKPA